MQRRTIVTTAAVLVGLAVGLVLSPTVRTTIANAQTTTQTTGTKTDFRSIFLDKLAAALHIQRPALDSAVKDASSGTVDEAVKQGKLTQAQADKMKAAIQSGNFNGFWGGRGGMRGGMAGGQAMFGVEQAMLNAAAKTLNLTPQAFMQQLRSGQTLAQLAQAHNTTEQAVTNAALAAAKTQLDTAVANKTLTQAQADAFYAKLQQAGTNLLNHQGRGFGRPNRSAPGTPATPQAPSTTPGV
ncbi:MAG: hypothetical protein H0X37_00820 [Herpetosiphonaceae bacterium]|nr:hypothetical protein [Herpetosiphonaceae bacterium]